MDSISSLFIRTCNAYTVLGAPKSSYQLSDFRERMLSSIIIACGKHLVQMLNWTSYRSSLLCAGEIVYTRTDTHTSNCSQPPHSECYTQESVCVCVHLYSDIPGDVTETLRVMGIKEYWNENRSHASSSQKTMMVIMVLVFKAFRVFFFALSICLCCRCCQ